MADDNTASSFLSHLQGGGGTQPQAPGAGQAHNHSHGHHHAGDHHHHVAAAAGHGHGHGHGHGDEDHWDADEYVTKPGMQETAALNAENIVFALARAGVDAATLPSLSLLEVGCGPGVVTAHLVDKFGSVHSIDTSPRMLTKFAETYADKETEGKVSWALHQLDSKSGDAFMRGTPMPSPTPQDAGRQVRPPRERFDVAVAVLVVHHVDDLESFFKGVFSVLEPGGKVVITEFTTYANGRDVLQELSAERAKEKAEAAAKAGGSVNAPGVHHAPFSPELLGALLNRYGFVDVGGDRNGTLPVFGTDKEGVPTMYVYGTKPK